MRRRRAPRAHAPGLLAVHSSPRRRARATSWARRELTNQTLAACTSLFGECAELIAVVRAELARAPDLDDASRVKLIELVHELITVEQFGRIAILAALLPQPETQDA